MVARPAVNPTPGFSTPHPTGGIGGRWLLALWTGGLGRPSCQNLDLPTCSEGVVSACSPGGPRESIPGTPHAPGPDQRTGKLLPGPQNRWTGEDDSLRQAVLLRQERQPEIHPLPAVHEICAPVRREGSGAYDVY